MAATRCTANCAPQLMCSLERARVGRGLLARSVRLELSHGAVRAFRALSAARAESGIPGFDEECHRFDALCATCMYDPPSSRDS